MAGSGTEVRRLTRGRAGEGSSVVVVVVAVVVAAAAVVVAVVVRSSSSSRNISEPAAFEFQYVLLLFNHWFTETMSPQTFGPKFLCLDTQIQGGAVWGFV